MKRRQFVTLLVGAAAWPLGARAQQAGKLPTIGALVIGNTNPEQFWREFRQGLRDLGYREGQDVTIETRYAQGVVKKLPDLVAELILPVEQPTKFELIPQSQDREGAEAAVPQSVLVRADQVMR